jgi:hypothetical protein
MSDSELPEPQEPKPQFQLNVQVFQIFGLVIIALALPFTILILGLLDIRKNTKPDAPAKATETIQTAAESPELRSSLNSIAESRMPAPVLDDGIRRFVYIPQNNRRDATVTALKITLENVGAVCLDATHIQKFLAHVPVEKAAKFESDLQALEPSKKPNNPVPVVSHSSVTYEITILRD